MCSVLVAGRPRRRCRRRAARTWFEFPLCAHHIGDLSRVKAVADPTGWVSEVQWDFARREYVPVTPERPTAPYPFPWPQLPIEARRVPIEAFNAESAPEQRETA